MTDIVERLRSPEVFIDTGGMTSPVACVAADEIERLRTQVGRMTTALKNMLEVLPAKTMPADVVRALLEDAR